jgi:putative lipoprotein
MQLASGRRGAVLALLTLAAAGCSSVTTAPSVSDQALGAAIREALDGYEGDFRYYARPVDLNGDGRDEIVAHVVSPMYCGTGGCPTLVFTQHDGGLRKVSYVSITRPPIVAAETTSNGWRDLVVHVSGGGILPGYDARLRFDGRSYPLNPSVPPAEPVKGAVTGTVLVTNADLSTPGKTR